MTLGLSLAAFTQLHVIISLIAVATGFVVAAGMIRGAAIPRWTAIFLATTLATSVTGFMFPFVAIGPGHIFGAISLVALTIGTLGLYRFHLRGRWRAAYIVTALLSLYLNVFVLVVQGFLKVAAIKALAPTQTEPPFAIAQASVLIAFLAVGFFALKRFHPAPLAAAPA